MGAVSPAQNRFSPARRGAWADAWLQQPEAARELVGGQAGETQALMGPRVVLLVEAAQEGDEIGGTTPRLRGQPLLEGAHEALGDAVRLGTMAGDEDPLQRSV